jgi:ribosome-binding protein aMBF1 (putative translation factor)
MSLGLLSYSQLLGGTWMGHYCRICGRERPNEQFSGKGHRIHVCKRCKARPESERQAIEDKDDIFAFLEQSRISEKNVAHLERMAKSNNPQVASLAAIVLDVARVKPYKTRRLKFLAQKHPELLGKLRDTGLVLVRHW